jgi:hypothetical protein
MSAAGAEYAHAQVSEQFQCESPFDRVVAEAESDPLPRE